MAWNEERTTKLKTLWAEGLSASMIAARLGHITRNSVIGKVHRLGLARQEDARHHTLRGRLLPWKPRPRRTPRGALPSAPPTQAASAPCPAVPGSPLPFRGRSGRSFRGLTAYYETAPAVSDLVIPPEKRVPLLSLKEGMCRWPIGDPRDPEFGFCGRKTCGAPLPYCEDHYRDAVQPQSWIPQQYRKAG